MNESSIFTQIIEKSRELYDDPDKKIIQPNWIEQYSTRVREILKRNKNDNRISLLAVSWTPWAGKGGFIKELAYLIKIILKKKSKSDERVMKLWDYDDHNIHYLYVMLDWFFKEIWALRRTEMLRSMDNFLTMFSDDKKALAFIERYIDTYEWFDFDNIYLKRAEERAAWAANSIFRVRKREKKDNSVIILDGLNSHKIADKLAKKDTKEAINVIKVMIFPRLERTFARLVKRDSINSNDDKSIKNVVSFRLKELFYVFNAFTLPSLMQDDIHLFDFSRDTDQSLTKEHMQEVIFALQESAEELLSEHLWTEFDKYIYDIVNHMVAYFENMIRHNEYVTKDYEHQESQIRLTEKNNRKENVKKHRAKRYTKK
jgi:hypothetical protein